MKGMQFALEVSGVSKTFRRWWTRRREVRALRNVSFGVAPGSIFGLLGPNGAGKTTLVKIALTIAYPDAGEIRLLGESIRDRSVLKRVGYLPENPRFPTHLTAIQVLKLYGSLSGADMKRVRENAAKWLERLGLAEWLTARLGGRPTVSIRWRGGKSARSAVSWRIAAKRYSSTRISWRKSN